MHIVDTYFREGAPDFVPLSSECRGAILASKASSTLIFGKAREEMMEKLRGSRETPVREQLKRGGDRPVVSNTCRTLIGCFGLVVTCFYCFDGSLDFLDIIRKLAYQTIAALRCTDALRTRYTF